MSRQLVPIAEGIVFAFASCIPLLVGSIIVAIAHGSASVPLVFSATATTPRDLPDIEVSGSPLAFLLAFVALAVAYVALSRTGQSRRNATTGADGGHRA